ncbi:lipid asymmetry maintenance protein MlaB [Pseudomaricurvus sp. HS19]|uniref:STAS domain-containing protein n=1 Tax=Pseudomaricurvus sp. HS19 TaxID=2692626 RepID=UPI00136FD227|nr:STAS domain-containing protein [Pseudomaricurvus sp. HS19]MYM63088.1 STAS domain-containing protein [Pseudomaricurvus sp. HS19]
MNAVASLEFGGDTLYVQGVVDFHSVVALLHAGNDWLRQQAPPSCQLDFSRITSCNSAATTLLLSWLRTAADVDKQVRVSALPERLRSLMDLGGLQDLVPAAG